VSIGLACLACACGASPAADPETPEGPSESAEAPPGDESSSEQSGETSAPGSEASPSSEATSGELGEDDVEAVLEQLLEDPGLDRYLHLDQRGRLPLKISGPGVPAKLKIIKGSHEVKVVDGPSSAKDPVLVFTKIERDGESVRLRYQYDVEGIKGSAVVFRKEGVWRLGANRVIEK
jgi:hypothetical protein